MVINSIADKPQCNGSIFKEIGNPSASPNPPNRLVYLRRDGKLPVHIDVTALVKAALAKMAGVEETLAEA